MRRNPASALAVVPLAMSLLRAQSLRYPLSVAGATYLEQVHTDVTSASGSAERHRIIVRSAWYSTSLRMDTLVVTADSLRLDETADNVRRDVDVDAVIGGRWKLVVAARDSVAVVEVPFVPGEVADVSDVGSAMDDFFPVAPPALSPGGQRADSAGRTWRRLADSGQVRRYRWSERRHRDGTSVASDSVPVHALVDTHEEGELAWSAARGPQAWTRRIQSTVTSRFAGRTVRAIVDQRIAVTRR